MGTLYLEAAGTVGRFRANGTTFAFDSQGLIAGCDAMLDGGVGLVANATGADWFPMMVPATNLPTVTPAANNSPALANTINAPSGFDPMAPGNIWASFGTTGVEGDVYAVELTRTSAVGAVAENVRRESVSRSLSWVLEAPYNATPVTESGTSVASAISIILPGIVLFAGGGSGAIAEVPQASGQALLAFTGGTTMAWSSSKDAYGFTFTLSTAKTIKGVGFYDVNGTGLAGAYSIALFADSLDFASTWVFFDAGENHQIMEIPSGTTAPLDGAWRRVDLTTQGATLQTNVTYTLVCEPLSMSNVDSLKKNVTGVTTVSGATFGQNYAWNLSHVASTTSSDGTAYFGPMIFFE
jgi:hypothetical protein